MRLMSRLATKSSKELIDGFILGTVKNEMILPE